MRALLQNSAGLKVVGEARNATEVLDSMRLLPDVILMELDLGPDNGLDILETLSKLNPRPRVIVVTASRIVNGTFRPLARAQWGSYRSSTE